MPVHESQVLVSHLWSLLTWSNQGPFAWCPMRGWSFGTHQHESDMGWLTRVYLFTAYPLRQEVRKTCFIPQCHACACLCTACTPGWFGRNCASRCLCQNGATCDVFTGSCLCAAGYQGSTCDQRKTALAFCQQLCGCLLSWYRPFLSRTIVFLERAIFTSLGRNNTSVFESMPWRKYRTVLSPRYLRVQMEKFQMLIPKKLLILRMVPEQVEAWGT